MALRLGGWIPDTCVGSSSEQCYVKHEYDDRTQAHERTHTPREVLRRCRAHQNISDLATLYQTIHEENVRKNEAIGLIMLNATRGVETTSTANGDEVKFSKGFGASWSFNDSRVLIITMRGYRPLELQAFQSRMNTAFGSGKVVIQ